MTREDGVRSYSYTCAEPLLANYKINIDATYTGSTFNMTGTLTGATWAGERTITFQFDEENVSGDETEEQGGGNQGGGGDNNDNTDNIIHGAAPEEGTAYQGCYVLSSAVQTDGSSLVTLMSPTQMSGLNFDANDQSSISAAVETAINTLAVSGIGGWRLPNLEEMEFMSENQDAVNDNLRSLNMTPLSLGNSTDYFFAKADGTISSYKIASGTELNYQNDKTKLRAVTTLTFKEN